MSGSSLFWGKLCGGLSVGQGDRFFPQTEVFRQSLGERGVELARSRAANLHTCAAAYAACGVGLHDIVGIDGLCGTDSYTCTAAGTHLLIGMGKKYHGLLGLTAAVLHDETYKPLHGFCWGGGVLQPGDINGCEVVTCQLCGNGTAELLCTGDVLLVGTVDGYRELLATVGMLADKGTCGDGGETALRDKLRQLVERVFKGTVAIDGYQYGWGVVALQPFETLQDDGRNMTSVDRYGKESDLTVSQVELWSLGVGQVVEAYLFLADHAAADGQRYFP